MAVKKQVWLSTIELADLQRQVEMWGDRAAGMKAIDNPVAAAQAVARGILLRRRKGEEVDLTPCHSLSPNPAGFVLDARECQGCFDKLTCMVALHRLGRTRPTVLVGDRQWDPESPEEMAEALPLGGMDEDGGEAVDQMPRSRLLAIARMMGLEVPAGTTRQKLAAQIHEARSQLAVNELAQLSKLRFGERKDGVVPGAKTIDARKQLRAPPKEPPKPSEEPMAISSNIDGRWADGTWLVPRGTLRGDPVRCQVVLIDGYQSYQIGSKTYSSPTAAATAVLAAWGVAGGPPYKGLNGRRWWKPEGAA